MLSLMRDNVALNGLESSVQVEELNWYVGLEDLQKCQSDPH
jgi:hypothetical protein